MGLPKELEKRVVAKLFDDALRISWDAMNPRQRSEQYMKWVADPDIGGRLTEYLTEANARLWIKDGPMKEWSRAKNGVGKYASLIADSDGIPSRLVSRALGVEWIADLESISEKPLRIVARREEAEVVVAWSPRTGLKHLVWAALQANVNGDTRRWVLCLIESFTDPTPANEKRVHQRLSARCELDIKHIVL